jgi:hypothetical protein
VPCQSRPNRITIISKLPRIVCFPVTKYEVTRTCFTMALYTASFLSGPLSVCFRNASKTETMMPASIVSRSTTKNTATENTSTAILTPLFRISRAGTRLQGKEGNSATPGS